MSFGPNCGVDLADNPFRINYKGCAIPIHRTFVVALTNAACFEQSSIGISQQVDRKRELVAEILVRFNIVLTDTNYVNAILLEFIFGGSERLALNSAAWRIVFGIEVHN